MATPPTYYLHDLGPMAQRMAKDFKNERLAITMQYVAIGCMIIMAGAAAAHLIKDLFRDSDRHGRSS
jgi:hypothetical protein